MQDSSGTIAALDVGGRRIGVALARMPAALPSPYTTLLNDADIWENLQRLVDEEQVSQIVVGLPRGLSGQETAQTASVREFAAALKTRLSMSPVLQDEALTSKKAEAELMSRKKRYNKEMVDALAATYILEDYLRELGGINA